MDCSLLGGSETLNRGCTICIPAIVGVAVGLGLDVAVAVGLGVSPGAKVAVGVAVGLGVLVAVGGPAGLVGVAVAAGCVGVGVASSPQAKIKSVKITNSDKAKYNFFCLICFNISILSPLIIGSGWADH